MKDPFLFYSEASLVQCTPFVADSLPGMLECLHRVSGSSIFYHFYYSLLQRHFLKTEFQNDFALWADQTLLEPVLAERLATVDPLDFPSVRASRNRLIEYVEAFVGESQTYIRVPPGKEFRFQELKSFSYPSGLQAKTLEEFGRVVRRISVESVFYHMVEARLRLENGTNDFSLWIEGSWGEPELARRIEALNPYRFGLSDMRLQISKLVQERLQP
jgi:Family of unknown function (DUF5752)